MNKEVLEIHHDPLWVSGERLFKNSDESQAWSRPLANGDVAVVLYNAIASDPVNIKVLFTDISLDQSKEYIVRDLWAGRDLATVTGSFTAEVGKHDVAYLRIRPAV
jgi:alpha-galactosidase